MDVGSPLVAHRETTEAVEPGQRAFDDPAMASELSTRLDTTAGSPTHIVLGPTCDLAASKERATMTPRL